MKHRTTADGHVRVSGGRERLWAVLLLLAFVGLVWAAYAGVFDRPVAAAARWLDGATSALAEPPVPTASTAPATAQAGA